jgi:hypothetical protein
VSVPDSQPQPPESGQTRLVGGSQRLGDGLSGARVHQIRDRHLTAGDYLVDQRATGGQECEVVFHGEVLSKIHFPSKANKKHKNRQKTMFCHQKYIEINTLHKNLGASI